MRAAAWLFLALGLQAGCAHWGQPRPVPLPMEASAAEVRNHILAPAGEHVSLTQAVISTEAEDRGEPSAFSLPDAVAYALRNSPRLRAARAAIALARGEVQVAFAPFLPTVDFAYRGVGFTNEVQVTSEHMPAVVGFGPGTQTFAQGELRLQWTIHDFGRTAGRYGQALSHEQIARLRAWRADETVVYDVAAAYLRVLFARASRLVQQQSILRAEAIVKDTKARRRGGVADRDDVLRAEVQLSEAREGLATARQLEFDALARLNFVMGRNVSQPLEVIDLDSRPEFTMSLTACLETAAEWRREVEIARTAVAAASYGLEAARAEYRPRIYVKGLVARIDGSGVANEDVQAAGIHFDQRLFDGFRRRGQRDAARAEVQAAVANGQQILDLIALEVNLAFREIASTRERIHLAETSVAQAGENLRLVRVKYLNGDATPTDIVDAETTLTRSQQRFYSAVYSYLTALARLDYAMGRSQGGFLASESRDVPTEVIPPPRRLPE